MSGKAKTEVKHISKGSAAGIAAACLVIGFLGGVVYSTYFAPPATVAMSPFVPGAGAPQAPAITPQQTDRILALEKQVSADPENPGAWLELGNLYFDTGNHQGAIRAYTAYLDSNPANPNVWTDLGVMYRRAGQPNEAVEAFDRALSLDPEHQQSRYNKGVVLLHDLKQPEAALREWRTLAEKNPGFRTPEGRFIRDVIDNR